MDEGVVGVLSRVVGVGVGSGVGLGVCVDAVALEMVTTASGDVVWFPVASRAVAVRV